MPERFVSSRACRCAQNVFTCVFTAVGQVAQSYWLMTIRFPSGRDNGDEQITMGFAPPPAAMMIFNHQNQFCHPERMSRSPERSEGEGSAQRERPFAALRVTTHCRSWSLKFIIARLRRY